MIMIFHQASNGFRLNGLVTAWEEIPPEAILMITGKPNISQSSWCIPVIVFTGIQGELCHKKQYGSNTFQKCAKSAETSLPEKR
jgi:hypothetical protein